MTNVLARLFLKRIFDTLAKPGIMAPHEGFEIELMIAGKKPAMITGWPLEDNSLEGLSKLQPFVESGDIIVIDKQVDEFQTHIICHAAHTDSAKRHVLIGEKREKHMSEVNEYHSFIKDIFKAATIQEFCDRSNNLHAIEHETAMLLEGKIGATVPLRTGINFGTLAPNIMDKIQKGELQTVHVRSSFVGRAVLSPKNSVDMGRELAARYLHNEKGYPPLAKEQFIERIGELLGYTKADTDFFTRIKQLKSHEYTIWDELRIACYPLQRYARAQSLLMDDPTPL